MKEVVRADPVYRRRFLMTMVLASVVGTVVLWRIEPYLTALQVELKHQVPRERLVQILNQLGVGALVMYIFLWIGAAALFRDGLRIRRAGQFPPPGAKVLRDTPVVRGDIARMRATLLMASGVLLGVCLVVLGLMGLQLALVLKEAS